MSKSFSIEIEFLVGTDIEKAVSEAKKFAINMDIAYTKFDFNGIKCSVSQHANLASAKDLYHQSIELKHNFVVFT